MIRPPPSARTLRAAADLRAAGSTWAQVAAHVGRAENTVRQWPTAFPKRWAAALAAAEAQLLAAAAAESVHTLRQQLRSDDEKARQGAAEKLIRYRVAVAKPAPPPPEPPRSDFRRAADFLEGLTDDELARFAAGLAAGSPPVGGPHGPGAPGGGG
jgi:hypothetical protein